MRVLLLAATLLAATTSLSLAGDSAAASTPAGATIGLCFGLPEADSIYGDGTAAGELFAIYATEINPDVLIFDEPTRRPAHTPILHDAARKGPAGAAPYR